jgi:uncharacterized membrane protein
MQEWDGNNYRLWTQILIVVCIVSLLIDRFTASDGNALFWLAIFFLAVGIFLVPDGPQPPSDQD